MFRKKLQDGGEMIMIQGKPGTTIRLHQTFDTAPKVQVTKFRLPGVAVKPTPPGPDPVKPDPVNPKPPGPRPTKYDKVQVVVLEDPSRTTPQQSIGLRQVRLSEVGNDLKIFDVVKGQDETGNQSKVVESYIKNVDSGKPYPYWFIVGVDGAKGRIVKEGTFTAAAEVIDEYRQAKKTSGSVNTDAYEW